MPSGHLTRFLGPEGTRRNPLAVERCRLSSLSPRIGEGTGAPPVYGGILGSVSIRIGLTEFFRKMSQQMESALPFEASNLSAPVFCVLLGLELHASAAIPE